MEGRRIAGIRRPFLPVVSSQANQPQVIRYRGRRTEGRLAMGIVAILTLIAGCTKPAPDAFAVRCAYREAVERVYYRHRLGDKPPFEETLPRETLHALVRKDMREEVILKDVYGVEISPALLGAEVKRINTTTRAPDMLAEIKAALGNDPVRFAHVFAKPILVERTLRQRFENHNALHAPQRQACEAVRSRLLAAKTNGMDTAQLLEHVRGSGSNRVTETTWKLGERTPTTHTPSPDTASIKKRFGPDAKPLSSPSTEADERDVYFEDMPPALRKVLRAQLRQAGDVSAVIETPSGFVLYLAKEKTEHELAVACMALPKRNYEEWLEEQK